MKILVTGSNGLLGKKLISLLSREHKIFAIVNKKNKLRPNKNIKILKIDLSNFQSRDLPKNIDFIIHLAQSNFYHLFPEKAEDIFKVNIESTFKLINFAYRYKIKNFLFTSTGDVTLSKTKKKIDSFYITSKAIGEIIINKYADILNVTVLRLFGLYDDNQKSGLIYNLKSKIKKNETVFLNGKGEGDLVYLTHVDDCAMCIEYFVKNKLSGTFDIAPLKKISIRNIIKILSNKYNKKPIIKHRNLIEKKKFMPNLTNLKKIYNISLLRDPATGLKDLK